MRRFVLCAAVCALLAPAPALAVGSIDGHESETGATFDARDGFVTPTAVQRARASELGAVVRWNKFGTPASLRKEGGYLAEGLSGSAAEAARQWLSDNAGLFRLSPSAVQALELVNDSQLAGSEGHAVLFRQRFGDLAAAQEGMVSVGVVGGKIAYASSSLAGESAAPQAATLTPVEGWLRAAAQAGKNVSIVNVTSQRVVDGWTVFTVSGFAQQQQARVVALAVPGEGARAVVEANVVNVNGADVTAFTSYVDARSGDVVTRVTRVEHLAESTALPFSGSYTPTACGTFHHFEVGAGNKSIDVTATAPGNDIILELYGPAGDKLAISDIPLGPNPEVIHYEPATLEAGTYSVRVCPFDPAQLPPYTYTGTFAATPVEGGGGTLPGLPPTGAPVPYPPKWNIFLANPPLDLSSRDTRTLGCWEKTVNGVTDPDCELELKNPGARQPWDHDVRSNLPTFTTKGNAALTGEAWASPLTPAEQYRPVSPLRNYNFPWTNQWQSGGCSQSSFGSPQRNDIDAAVANLFATHNQMHDWSYSLGFTEATWNMQESNLGSPDNEGAKENDPEIGNAQAGAVDGGYPSFQGRDNANQITLQDGTPGITNMYLWQPIAGGFYAPCVDGDYDMSVIGHEYTHAISNRMVGGPDAGLTADQSRAMGESWSDLVAVEYLSEHGYVPTDDENPFAVGPYATGNKQTGIRNFAMNDSPLNFSDVGYDMACNVDIAFSNCTGETQVHADGEIWSATNYDIRQALVAKHGAGDAATQLACARGELEADACPGNRRWIQIMFDAFLLMQPDVSMLDAREAYLAADQMRFGGANQAELWHVFATRGMGDSASTGNEDDPEHPVEGGNDVDPIPAFDSPLEDEASLTFKLVDETGAAVAGNVYAGRFEARATPIADTDPATARGDSAPFVAGTYEFVAGATGHGLVRFSALAEPGKSRIVTVTMPTNWASSSEGASATGDGVNHDALIDDTEETNWAAVGRTPTVAGTQVTVDLGGGAHVVDRVNVSALLRLKNPEDDNDAEGQNRFTALRAFEIHTSTDGVTFQKIYESAGDAFPGGIPRPLAPNLIFRTFDVPNTTATHVRLVVVSNQCTGGPAYQGEQDSDPANVTDCPAGSVQDEKVRAAELQVFSAPATSSQPGPGPGSGGGGGGGAGGGAPAQPAPPAAQPAPAPPAGGVAGVATTQKRFVRGLGAIKAKGATKRASFQVNLAKGPLGKVVYRDLVSKRRMLFRNLKLQSIRYAGKTVTLTGTGKANGKQVRYVAVVTDRGAGRLDTFRIKLSTGYVHSGRLVRGDVVVR